MCQPKLVTKKNVLILLYTLVAITFVYYFFPEMSASESSSYKAMAKDIKALVDGTLHNWYSLPIWLPIRSNADLPFCFPF